MIKQDETVDSMVRIEEDILLDKVGRGLHAERLGYAVGTSGLAPLQDFLNGHLPPTLYGVVGRITTPDDKLSSEPAVLIIDPRYPILREDLDGVCTVMAHSVVAAVIVATDVSSGDVVDVFNRAWDTELLFPEGDAFSRENRRKALVLGFAYHLEGRAEDVAQELTGKAKHWQEGFELFVLRTEETEQPLRNERGVAMTVAPAGEGTSPDGPADRDASVYIERMGLADFWHRLVVRVNSILLSRDLKDEDIENHLRLYVSWASFLEEVIKMRQEASGEEAPSHPYPHDPR